jgi:hypothetical protein
MGNASFSVFKRTAKKSKCQMGLRVFCGVVQFTFCHPAHSLLVSIQRFKCGKFCSPLESSRVTALALTCYELPTPLQKFCCSEIKSGRKKSFVEVSPIRKAKALKFVWLTALVLSQGVNCHLGSLTVCMEIFFFRFLWPCIVSKVWREKNQEDATIRCLSLTSISTCFGHHYAHLQENK